MPPLDPVREFLRARGCSDEVVVGGLEGLVQGWEDTVESVARGYPLGLDDYLNDMDARELIEDALEAVAEGRTYEVLDRLRFADGRMRRLLVGAGRCLWGASIALMNGWTPEQNWWYFMQPREPGPELSGDLETR